MKKIILILISIGFISCQSQNKQKEDNQMQDKILIQQLKAGALASNEVTDIPLPYKYGEQDFNTSLPIIKRILNENGYQQDPVIFRQKVKKIFNLDIEKIAIIDLMEEKCKKNVGFDMFNFPYSRYYFVENEAFITNSFYLPQLYDYKKKFPEYSNIEEEVKTKFKDKNNEFVYIVRWKDIPDLDQQRKKNIETLVARNMYLFNDSKAHFKWLILNDEYFMRSLVTTFGYYDDKELLKWVLENTPVFKDGDSKSKFDELSKIFWNKKCDNNYSININLLTIIKELSTPEKNDRIINVFQIAQELVYMTNTVSSFSEIPFKDRAKILAHLLEFGEQYKYNKEYDYNQLFLGRFIYYLDYKKEFITEFKKNNYYDLPNLKKWYELALKEKNIFQDDDSLMGEPDYEDYLSKSRSNQ